MVKYSINRALAELKLLDKRINKGIDISTFIGSKKNSSVYENTTHKTNEDFEELVKSNFRSITDLIANRKAIKEAIVNSNAVTKVTISGKEYTVASAIERKASIGYEKDLLEEMERQYRNVISSVNSKNEIMERNLDSQLSAMLGAEKTKSDESNAFAEGYRKQNGWDVIDPLNLEKVIRELRTEIEDFESEVDYVLSTSNSLTEIEI